MVTNYGPPGMTPNPNQPVWTTTHSNNSGSIHTPQQFGERFPDAERRLQATENKLNQHKAEADANKWVAQNDINQIRQRMDDFEVELHKFGQAMEKLIEVVGRLVTLEEERSGVPMEELDMDQFQRELADPDAII